MSDNRYVILDYSREEHPVIRIGSKAQLHKELEQLKKSVENSAVGHADQYELMSVYVYNLAFGRRFPLNEFKNS